MKIYCWYTISENANPLRGIRVARQQPHPRTSLRRQPLSFNGFVDLPKPKTCVPLLWFVAVVVSVIIAHDYLLPLVPIDLQRAVPAIAETCALALAVLILWSGSVRAFIVDNLISRNRATVGGFALLIVVAIFLGVGVTLIGQRSDWQQFVNSMGSYSYMTDNDAWLAVANGDLGGTLTGWWRFGLNAIILGPVWETVALVAIAFPLLRRIVHPAVAMIVGGVLFAIMHYPQATSTGLLPGLPDWFGYASLGLSGVLMIWLYCWTRSLLIPILWHAISNTAVTIMTFTIGWCTSC